MNGLFVCLAEVEWMKWMDRLKWKRVDMTQKKKLNVVELAEGVNEMKENC